MKFWRLAKEVLLSVLGNVLYFLSFFIPKNEKLWVFGGLLGEGYNDNSKYFFEHLYKTKKDVEAVWITQNSDIVSQLREKGYKSYLGYSFKGCWIVMRAGAAVISHSRVRDLKPFTITSKVKFIQLWHGIPLKKIEFDDKVFFNKQSFVNQTGFFVMKILVPGFRRRFDMMIASSQEDRDNFSSAFQLGKHKIKITGYPRNDEIIASANRKSDTGTAKKILYVPTFRGVEKSDFNLFDKYHFDSQSINEFLKERKIFLYIKLHPYNKPSQNFFKKIKLCSNLVFYEENDIYNSLGAFDMLITDYSSIYFDYLLLNRPVIFTPFDYDEYVKKDREFYYKYDEVTPGPKARNWDDVVKYVSMFFDNPDEYNDFRKAIADKFHFYKDSDSSERVYKE
ncbi:MAG: CDP-glycerol glycerophosphotransferase family protein, partial [Bacteroidota bacterium]